MRFVHVAAGSLILRGYSSAGRAVALQAIGQGFESPYLQTSAPPYLRLGEARFGKPSIRAAKFVRQSLLELKRQGVVGPAVDFNGGL